MLGDGGMKDKILDKVLDMLMSLKGSEDMEEKQEGELPEDPEKEKGALVVDIAAQPLKAKP